MKSKLTLVLALFAAGLGASYALADGGHGKADAGQRCRQVHVNGTIAAQQLTVTLDHGSKRLSLAAGSQVVLQLGATGQTVRVNAEACAVTADSGQQLVVKSVELHAKNPSRHGDGATTGTTTAP